VPGFHSTMKEKVIGTKSAKPSKKSKPFKKAKGFGSYTP